MVTDLRLENSKSTWPAKRKYSYSNTLHNSIVAEFEELKNDPKVLMQFHPHFAAEKLKYRAYRVTKAYNEFLTIYGMKEANMKESSWISQAVSEPKCSYDKQSQKLVESPKVKYDSLNGYTKVKSANTTHISADMFISFGLMKCLDIEQRIMKNPIIQAINSLESGLLTRCLEAIVVYAHQNSYHIPLKFKDSLKENELDRKIEETVVLYIWIVHGIDYYSLLDLGYYESSKNKPPPELCSSEHRSKTNISSEKITPITNPEHIPLDFTPLEIELTWRKRIEKGDDLGKFAKIEQIAAYLEKFIDKHVNQTNNKVWECLLHSQNHWTKKCKIFEDRKFAVNHIRRKHKEELQRVRKDIEQRIYKENFISFRKAQEERGGKDRIDKTKKIKLKPLRDIRDPICPTGLSCSCCFKYPEIPFLPMMPISGCRSFKNHFPNCQDKCRINPCGFNANYGQTGYPWTAKFSCFSFDQEDTTSNLMDYSDLR